MQPATFNSIHRSPDDMQPSPQCFSMYVSCDKTLWADISAKLSPVCPAKRNANLWTVILCTELMANKFDLIWFDVTSDRKLPLHTITLKATNFDVPLWPTIRYCDNVAARKLTWQAAVVVERMAWCWTSVTVQYEVESSQRQWRRVGSVASPSASSWSGGDAGAWLMSVFSLLLASCSTSLSTFASSVSHLIWHNMRHMIGRLRK